MSTWPRDLKCWGSAKGGLEGPEAEVCNGPRGWHQVVLAVSRLRRALLWSDACGTAVEALCSGSEGLMALVQGRVGVLDRLGGTALQVHTGVAGLW